jgi:protein-tyrosine phosphatase
MDNHSRHLPWEACLNVRDLGGYRTAGGSDTRWGAFVRADNLARLTPRGRQSLVDYGVRTVIDLRFPEELKIDPPPFASEEARNGVITFYHLPFIGEVDEATRVAWNAATTTADSYFVTLGRSQANIAAVMTAIARASSGGVLFHCHAGKDRTGLVAAMLLALVGVPDETIGRDYWLTRTYLQPTFDQWLEELTTEDPIVRARQIEGFECRPETMLAVLDHLRQTYGGVEAYLSACGVTSEDIETMRRRLMD